MVGLNDFIEVEGLERRSSGVLYINIYPVSDYPRKIKVSKLPYDESFSRGKWRKRIGTLVYYYGNCIKAQPVEIDIDNSLFGGAYKFRR